MRGPVSPLCLVIFCVAVLVPSAQAQQQEKKMMDRINAPDRSQASQFQSKKYDGGGHLQIKSASYANASFNGSRSALVKDFSGTRSFLGIKNPWFGEKVFASKSADLSAKGGLPNSRRSFDTKSASVKNYSAATKQANIGSSVVPTRPFLVQGSSQPSFDQISAKMKKEMTIDEVRELLNKSR